MTTGISFGGHALLQRRQGMGARPEAGVDPPPRVSGMPGHATFANAQCRRKRPSIQGLGFLGCGEGNLSLPSKSTSSAIVVPTQPSAGLSCFSALLMPCWQPSRIEAEYRRNARCPPTSSRVYGAIVGEEPDAEFTRDDERSSHRYSLLQDTEVFEVGVQEEPRSYVITNRLLEDSGFPGLGYRRSKNMEDRVDQAMLPVTWGCEVQGVDEGDGWLRVGDVFLPMRYLGMPVVVLACARYDGESRTEQAKARLTIETEVHLTGLPVGQPSPLGMLGGLLQEKHGDTSPASCLDAEASPLACQDTVPELPFVRLTGKPAPLSCLDEKENDPSPSTCAPDTPMPMLTPFSVVSFPSPTADDWSPTATENVEGL